MQLSRLNRLILVGDCLLDAIQTDQEPEIRLLLEERALAISDLTESGAQLSPEQKALVLKSGEALNSALESKKSRIVGRLRQINSAKKVRQAYKGA